ncbi:MAG TPA: D-alanyl-D-alanine carboxypeptidase/D-alanyl-D-alanine-endopeptidase [Solirubrobacteraceae bacterium]|jgi:D-alanyl-D-alanine carboxypeptidase/D-alanyl-D-alanine-endopeptidase (penicillin-binding protein 4)
MRRTALLALTIAAFSGAFPHAGDAQSTLSAQLSHELALAGPASGAYIYDLNTSTPLFAERATTARPPASVEKLYTATTALELMGPSATLSTTVLGTGQLGRDGRWEGNLYLRGGGDPTFGSALFTSLHYGGQGATIQALAAQLAHTDGIRTVTGTVNGDESFFDSLRGEPASGYRFDPDLEGNLSALAFNRGETGSQSEPHAPAAYAALQLRGALRAYHVTVHSGGAATTPPDAKLLATVRSPTLARLLGLTLPPSDNFFAETLIKDLGALYGGAGTTSTGAAVVRRTIAHFHLHPHLLDGSGLSHSDHTTPLEVVSLLAQLAHSPLGTALRKDLAVAGRTGTLSERMRGTAASGRCEAKTGTLIGVSNLAGYCQSESGDILAFAFFTDGIATEAAHTIQDNMAITLARY